MSDPFAILGVPPEAEDAAIREAYLTLAREFTPERHPERFTAIRTAYESIRTLDRRARFRLYESGKDDTIDAILEEAACRTPRRRLSLETLLSVKTKPTVKPPSPR